MSWKEETQHDRSRRILLLSEGFNCLLIRSYSQIINGRGKVYWYIVSTKCNMQEGCNIADSAKWHHVRACTYMHINYCCNTLSAWCALDGYCEPPPTMQTIFYIPWQWHWQSPGSHSCCRPFLPLPAYGGFSWSCVSSPPVEDYMQGQTERSREKESIAKYCI